MSEVKTEETTDTSHSVVVSRAVSGSVKQVWSRVVSEEGVTAILGEGGVLGDKGDTWRANDGTYGVIRTYHPLEQLRFTWHADAEAPSTMVDLRASQAGDGEVLVEIRHDRLGSEVDLEAVQRRWEAVLAGF
jgi:hypothetical protein